MKAGSFNLNEYLERLTEAAEEKEKVEIEKSAKAEGKAAPKGGSGEGLIIPEEWPFVYRKKDRYCLRSKNEQV